MTHDDAIKILAAHRAGKQIQEKWSTWKEWTPFDGEFVFDLTHGSDERWEYRIAPELTWEEVAQHMVHGPNRSRLAMGLGRVYLRCPPDTQAALRRDFNVIFTSARKELLDARDTDA